MRKVYKDVYALVAPQMNVSYELSSAQSFFSLDFNCTQTTPKCDAQNVAADESAQYSRLD